MIPTMHSTLWDAELPSWEPDVISRAMTRGRRRIRIHRTATVGVASVAVISMLTLGSMNGDQSTSTGLVAGQPNGGLSSAPASLPTLHTGINVSGSAAVLQLAVDGNQSTLALSLDAPVPLNADGLTPAAVESTITDPRGWAVAPVVNPELMTTGDVIVFGYLTGYTDVRVLVDGAPFTTEVVPPAGEVQTVEGYGGILQFDANNVAVPPSWPHLTKPTFSHWPSRREPCEASALMT